MSKPFVVGIAGGTASGKSTFATALAEALDGLDVKIVGMDRYFRQEKPIATAPLTGRQWPDYNQPGSFHLDDLVTDLDAMTGDVIIIEGLMVLQDERVRSRCDLKLFVDAAADERIVRRLKRNMAERGLSFDEIADYYLDSVRFRHDEYIEPTRWFADLVINGAMLSEAAVAAVVHHIKACIRDGE